jgi:hypothetical protein
MTINAKTLIANQPLESIAKSVYTTLKQLFQRKSTERTVIAWHLEAQVGKSLKYKNYRQGSTGTLTRWVMTTVLLLTLEADRNLKLP